ncbi:MAG: hypothetical protein AAB427_14180 [Chloroflexota bacterium]
MNQNPKHHRLGHYFDLPPRWRWIFWPVIAVSGGGTALALWLEEEAVAAAECAPLAALPGMAALLYWFNHLVFKATQPRREDLSDKTTSGDKTSNP